MGIESAGSRLAFLFRRLRINRSASQRQIADGAGVNSSVISRMERGADAKLSTWEKAFAALGYQLLFDVTELAEEIEDLLREEAERRRERRLEGLQRRFY